MSFFSSINKILRPIEDEYEDGEFLEDEPGKAETPKVKPSAAQENFEKKFTTAAQPESEEADEAAEGSIFGNLGNMIRRPKTEPKPPRERTVNVGGQDSRVILLQPRTFDEAFLLDSYLKAHRSVVMTLEGVDLDFARRLLDYISGISGSCGSTITPISGKTYFIAPKDINLLSATGAQPETRGETL